jgi:Polyphosphate kinase 2 (PPK2)
MVVTGGRQASDNPKHLQIHPRPDCRPLKGPLFGLIGQCAGCFGKCIRRNTPAAIPTWMHKPLAHEMAARNAIRLSHRIFVQRSNMPKNENKNQGTVAAAGADSAGPLPKIKREQFEKELNKLQVELTRSQAWTVAEGARIIVVFEGRDTAGKGGVISRITQRVSPRVFKHVALPAPSNRERSQLYMQRYLAHDLATYPRQPARHRAA